MGFSAIFQATQTRKFKISSIHFCIVFVVLFSFIFVQLSQHYELYRMVLSFCYQFVLSIIIIVDLYIHSNFASTTPQLVLMVLEVATVSEVLTDVRVLMDAKVLMDVVMASYLLGCIHRPMQLVFHFYPQKSHLQSQIGRAHV